MIFIEDSTISESLRLWNVQQRDAETTVPATVLSPIGSGAEDTLISAFQKEERVTLTGRATGTQIVSETSATDPLQAAASFATRLEGWVTGSTKNANVQLRSETSGRTVSVTPESVSWQVEQGSPTLVEWDLRARVGGGIVGSAEVNPPAATPGGEDTFDGILLPGVRQRRVERTVEINTINAFLEQDTEDTTQLIDSGVERRVSLSGRFTDTAAAQNSFDEALRQRAGDGETYTFSPAFPGGSRQAAIESFNSTRSAGSPGVGQYNLELIEGGGI